MTGVDKIAAPPAPAYGAPMTDESIERDQFTDDPPTADPRPDGLRSAPSLLVVNTGNGKGKTSSALGVTMRAWGRGWKICWLQFIKSKTANYGETRAAKAMGIEIIPLGDGFTWLSKDIEKDIALAHECWALAMEKIYSQQFDLVVLDEITYPVTYGWLEVDEVIEVLRARPENVFTDAELGRIDTDVHFIWGDADVYGPPAIGERAVSLMPRARLDVIPGNHAPFLDDPRACARLILDRQTVDADA